MEEFVNAVRMKYKKDTVTLNMPQSYLIPECLRQQSASILQERMDKRRQESVCSVCSKEDARKYVCSKTNKVTCSFECYKKVNEQMLVD